MERSHNVYAGRATSRRSRPRRSPIGSPRRPGRGGADADPAGSAARRGAARRLGRAGAGCAGSRSASACSSCSWSSGRRELLPVPCRRVAAHERLDRHVGQALDQQHGQRRTSSCSAPTTRQLAGPGREPLRLDHARPRRPAAPPHRVPVDPPRPARGHPRARGAKINAAMQLGGRPSRSQTMKELTGLPVNHVVDRRLQPVRDLIDKSAASTSTSPRRSSPSSTARTRRRRAAHTGRAGASRRAAAHGRAARARLLAHPQEQAESADTDFARASESSRCSRRHGEAAGLWTLPELPFMGVELLEPAATDLAAGAFISIGWSKLRSSAGTTLHCRLGGASRAAVRSTPWRRTGT